MEFVISSTASTKLAKTTDTAGGYIFVDYNGNSRTVVPEKVLFNGKATILFWSDGVKTVSVCKDGDEYNKETGVLNCIAQRYTKQLNKKVRKLIENAEDRNLKE